MNVKGCLLVALGAPLLSPSVVTAAPLAFDIVETYVHLVTGYPQALNEPVTARLEFDATGAADFYSIPNDPNNGAYNAPMTVTFKAGAIEFEASGTGQFYVYRNRSGKDEFGFNLTIDAIYGSPGSTFLIRNWQFAVDMPAGTLSSDQAPSPKEFLEIGRQPGGGNVTFRVLEPVGTDAGLGFAYGYMQPIDLVGQGFSSLLASATDNQLRKNLISSVTLAQAFFAADDIPTSCNLLAEFSAQVDKLASGRKPKLSPEAAASISANADATMYAIGCN